MASNEIQRKESSFQYCFHPGLMHKLSVKITDQNDMNEELVNFRSISKPHTMTDIIS